MLQIFSVLVDQRWPELREFSSQLRNDLRADEVFDGLLGRFVRVYVYVELLERQVSNETWEDRRVNEGDVRRTHLPPCRGLPPGP